MQLTTQMRECAADTQNNHHLQILHHVKAVIRNGEIRTNPDKETQICGITTMVGLLQHTLSVGTQKLNAQLRPGGFLKTAQ